MLDKKIYYFMAAVDEGSFSAAARKLYLSQSALSQQISIMENELGVKLFNRKGYRPVLTEAGKLYYEGCADIRARCETLKCHIKSLNSYSIRVGFDGAGENRYLFQALKWLRKEAPQLPIVLKKGPSPKRVENLINGKLDISFGLESEYRDLKDVEYRVLYEYDMCLICHQDHKMARAGEISIRQLADEDFIVLSEAFGEGFFRDFNRACKEDRFKMKVRKYADTFDELILAVSAGEGVAIASSDVVSQDEIRAIPLRDTHHKNRYVVAYRKNPQSNELKQFIDYIECYFRTI